MVLLPATCRQSDAVLDSLDLDSIDRGWCSIQGTHSFLVPPPSVGGVSLLGAGAGRYNAPSYL